ncbi:hypothetical protein GV828_00155 [Flavobacterium sp. NST-5]|uniref:Prenyltransferase n=1 Tax=Flavobacterium ichthyis TaxID=2698827 RepID=A0ABW9Z4J4_9FLAO|nr:hypothetical protein [Flavobacterium ichthyis]NBL63609.1 hypothetical protein [Flavobacterium ichthyis]
MQVAQKLFQFYVKASIHVAISVLSLVLMTNHMFQKPFDFEMAGFAFFGTIFGYNFIKFESFCRNKKKISREIKLIFGLSALSILISGYFFLQLKSNTQIVALIFSGFTFLYAIPLFSHKPNFRNWTGIKIYIVAFCWAGVTILLPLLNFETNISADVLLKFCQRFLLVIVLILIFEIIDLKTDDLKLQTVPQKIGVKNTKILGILLLIPFYFLEFFKSEIDEKQLIINAVLIVITSLFIYFAHENRSKYYTSFWVESIPIFWLAMVFLM